MNRKKIFLWLIIATIVAALAWIYSSTRAPEQLVLIRHTDLPREFRISNCLDRVIWLSHSVIEVKRTNSWVIHNKGIRGWKLRELGPHQTGYERAWCELPESEPWRLRIYVSYQADRFSPAAMKSWLDLYRRSDTSSKINTTIWKRPPFGNTFRAFSLPVAQLSDEVASTKGEPSR